MHTCIHAYKETANGHRACYTTYRYGQTYMYILYMLTMSTKNNEATNIFHKCLIIFVYISAHLRVYIWFRVPCCHPPPPHGMGPPPLPPYLMHFAHATVAKLTFPYFCMHAAVAKRTFSFCWMNPLAGFGGSIARNCGEMQILSSKNGSAQCTGHFNAQQMESYTYTYPCTYIFININSYICKNIYVYLHIHICTYPYTYRYIHIYINIYIHTSSTATTTTTTHTTGGVYYTDPLPYHYYHNYFHHHHYHHHHAPITHTTGGGMIHIHIHTYS